jgi:HK97 family phage major capsid protein
VKTRPSTRRGCSGRRVRPEELGAYKIGSGLILVPTELFEDTGLNLQQELVSIMGERLGRRRANKYTVGVGTTDFQGFVSARRSASPSPAWLRSPRTS